MYPPFLFEEGPGVQKNGVRLGLQDPGETKKIERETKKFGGQKILTIPGGNKKRREHSRE